MSISWPASAPPRSSVAFRPALGAARVRDSARDADWVLVLP